MSASTAAGSPSTPRSNRHRFHFGLWLWVATILGAAILFYGIVLALNWPFEKQALIDILQKRSLRQVTIEGYRNTYFPPGCVAEGIRFLRIKHKGKPPLITIRKLVLQDNYPNLLTFQKRLSTVKVIGLYVTVPSNEPDGEPSPMMPLTYSKSRSSMVIDTVLANDAVLDLLSGSPGKPAVRIVVNRLALRNIGSNTPVAYTVTLRNSEPTGQIRSTGSWGPWNPNQPGSTPVRGNYVYEHGDLSVFGEISGAFKSKGEFKGALGHITVNGTANVTDFQVKDTSHKRQLGTQFQAVVDGTNGDVFLNHVAAEFNSTALLFTGSISSQQGENGKAASLNVYSERARIEDLVDLFISGPVSPISGDISLSGHIGLPPGSDPFLKRLQVVGDFGVSGSKFTNRQTEREIARLSVSATKGDKEEDKENPPTVLSKLTGHVDAKEGIAHLSQISFQVPGAHAFLQGTFNLIDRYSDLTGVLVTKGDVADATNGFKSFLVKAITPFFKKERKAKIVPFKITGPYGKTAISLNLGSKKKQQPD